MGAQQSQVEAAIHEAKQHRNGALIGYLPVGFPDLDTSIEAAIALAQNGVDVIEFGLPYSDPVMDGVVIQQATRQALQRGFRVSQVFDAIRRVRAAVDVPVLVMTYINPVLQYGIERFAADLAAAGGAGLITPDITPEAAAEWIRLSDEHGLDRVFLAAPSSSDERLKMIVQQTTGFVYTVSTMGITGQRESLDAAARALTARLRTQGATLACVGIGVSTADHVATTLEYADGAIVGTVFVRALSEGGVEQLAATVRELAEGTRRSPVSTER
ncbi:MAG: tryptophan synthase subunit alpha [Leucobacter sp.]|nr:tryptophan synthase subunit alpha [Leucobacter sp.]